MALAKIRQIISLGLALLAAGCVKPSPTYTQPVLPVGQAVTIIPGSTPADPALGAATQATIDTIDGVQVDQFLGKIPLVVTPGQHRLTIAIAGGAEVPQGTGYGGIEVDYAFLAGTSYTIQLSQAKKRAQLCFTTTAWVTDGKGNIVWPKTEVFLQVPTEEPYPAGGAVGFLVSKAVPGLLGMNCPGKS